MEGGAGAGFPEELTPCQSWRINVTVRKEEAAAGLTPGGGDRAAGTRALEEGGTEPSSESLAEAGMQASRGGESPWRRKGKIRTGRGRGTEREKPWGCTGKKEGGSEWDRGPALPLLDQLGSFRATEQDAQRSTVRNRREGNQSDRQGG